MLQVGELAVCLEEQRDKMNEILEEFKGQDDLLTKCFQNDDMELYLLRLSYAHASIDKARSAFRDIVEFFDAKLAWEYSSLVEVYSDHRLEVEYPDIRNIRRYWPYRRFHYTAKDGSPCTYNLLGRLNFAKYRSVVNLESHRDLMFRQIVAEHRHINFLSRESGKYLQSTIIFDLQGLNVSHRGILDFIQFDLEWAQKLLPEVMKRTLVVNAPKIFASMWKVISKFLDPRTLEKISLSSSSESSARLLAVIDAENLPAIYGGNCSQCGLEGCIEMGTKQLSVKPRQRCVERVEFDNKELSEGSELEWRAYCEQGGVNLKICVADEETVLSECNLEAGEEYTGRIPLSNESSPTLEFRFDNSKSMLLGRSVIFDAVVVVAQQ